MIELNSLWCSVFKHNEGPADMRTHMSDCVCVCMYVSCVNLCSTFSLADQSYKCMHAYVYMCICFCHLACRLMDHFRTMQNQFVCMYVCMYMVNLNFFIPRSIRIYACMHAFRPLYLLTNPDDFRPFAKPIRQRYLCLHVCTEYLFTCRPIRILFVLCKNNTVFICFFANVLESAHAPVKASLYTLQQCMRVCVCVCIVPIYVRTYVLRMHTLP